MEKCPAVQLYVQAVHSYLCAQGVVVIVYPWSNDLLIHKLEEMDPVYSLGIWFCNWSDSKCLYVLKFCTQGIQEDLILEK